jgi:hypothetical protein
VFKFGNVGVVNQVKMKVIQEMIQIHKLMTKTEQKQYKMICCTNQKVWNIIVNIKIEKAEVIISI